MSLSDQVQPATPSALRSKRLRTRYNATMKLVRRVHLYAGLFMTPWVLLYGVTAMLFNHPGAFPDREIRNFGTSEVVGTPLEAFPSPSELASRVVDAMNRAALEDSADRLGSYRLVHPGEARFNRDLIATSRGDQGEEHTIRIDLNATRGRVQIGEPEQPQDDQPPAPFARASPLVLEPSPTQILNDGLPQLLSRLGIPGEVEISSRFAPQLEFDVEADDGTSWRVSYPILRGTLEGRPADAEGQPLSTRRFLLRLHLAHTYPSQVDARWFWALAVDAMFLSMIGWAATGLLMWWQMKNVRRVGAVVLMCSGLAATVLALGMHRILTS